MGATNSATKGQVTAVQNFLKDSGYMTVAATGRYGNLTVAAVKKLQKDLKILQTGTIGPLTRTAIEKMSCPAQVVQTPAAPIPAAPVIVTPSTNFSSPSAGTVMTIGDTFDLLWKGSENVSTIDILLKRTSGAGAGYIASGIPGNTNYMKWKVGDVSVAGKSNTIASPGNYQIVVNDELTSGSKLSFKSKTFKIVEKPLNIKRIIPTTPIADGRSSVMLYGEGLTKQTRVQFEGRNPDGWQFNPTATPNFVSTDGTFMTFVVPHYYYGGEYNMYLFNEYGGDDPDATSTPSNYLKLNIIEAAE